MGDALREQLLADLLPTDTLLRNFNFAEFDINGIPTIKLNAEQVNAMEQSILQNTDNNQDHTNSNRFFSSNDVTNVSGSDTENSEEIDNATSHLSSFTFEENFHLLHNSRDYDDETIRIPRNKPKNLSESEDTETDSTENNEIQCLETKTEEYVQPSTNTVPRMMGEDGKTIAFPFIPLIGPDGQIVGYMPIPTESNMQTFNAMSQNSFVMPTFTNGNVPIMLDQNNAKTIFIPQSIFPTASISTPTQHTQFQQPQTSIDLTKKTSINLEKHEKETPISSDENPETKSPINLEKKEKSSPINLRKTNVEIPQSKNELDEHQTQETHEEEKKQEAWKPIVRNDVTQRKRRTDARFASMRASKLLIQQTNTNNTPGKRNSKTVDLSQKNNKLTKSEGTIPTQWTTLRSRSADVALKPSKEDLSRPLTPRPKEFSLKKREQLTNSVHSSKREMMRIERTKKGIQRLKLKQQRELDAYKEKEEKRMQTFKSKYEAEVEKAKQLYEKDIELFEKSQEKTTKEQDTEFDETTKANDKKLDKLISLSEEKLQEARKNAKNACNETKNNILKQQKADYDTKKRNKFTYDKSYMKKLKASQKIEIQVYEKFYAIELEHLKHVSDAKLQLEQLEITNELISATNRQLFHSQVSLLQQKNIYIMNRFNEFMDAKTDARDILHSETVSELQVRYYYILMMSLHFIHYIFFF